MRRIRKHYHHIHREPRTDDLTRDSRTACVSQCWHVFKRTLMMCVIAALVLSCVTASGEVAPPVEQIWVGGACSWSNPNNWNPNDPKSPTSAPIRLIDNGNPINSTVSLDVNADVLRIVLDAGDHITIEDNRSLRIYSDISAGILVNSGWILLDGETQPSQIILSGDDVIQFEGGGLVELAGAGYSQIVGDVENAFLHNVDNTVMGRGSVGADTLGIINDGTIEANVAYETLVINPSESGMVNNGIMRGVDGGRLKLFDGTFLNSNGVISAESNGRVDLQSATIVGGMLMSQNTGLIRVKNSLASLQDVIIDANIEIDLAALSLYGLILNNGLLSAVNPVNTIQGTISSEIHLPTPSSDVTLDGNGMIVLDDAMIHSGNGLVGSRLINGINHTISGSGSIGRDTTALLNQGTIIAIGETSLEIDPPDLDCVINTGTMTALGPLGLVLTGGSFRNDGTIEVLEDSRVFYTATSTEENAQYSMLSGGTWRVLAGEGSATIIMPGSSILFNDAEVVLSGQGASFSKLNYLFSNSGRFSVLNGKEFTTTNTLFTNSGELTIGSTSTFTAIDEFTQYSGGSLRIEIGEMDKDNQISGLVVNGTANLAGTLELFESSNFLPIDGQMVQIITAGNTSGDFASVMLPPGWELNINNDTMYAKFTRPCPGDIDADGDVDVDDLGEIMIQWGPCPPKPDQCSADGNLDGTVDVDDLGEVFIGWGTCS